MLVRPCLDKMGETKGAWGSEWNETLQALLRYSQNPARKVPDETLVSAVDNVSCEIV